MCRRKVVPSFVPPVAGIFATLVASLLFTGGSLVAQETGVIQGQITDAQTGAVVRVGQVEVRALDGQIAGRVLTNNEGRFRVVVPSGSYQVTFRGVGYSTAEFGAVQVTAGGISTLDRTVEAGTAWVLDPMVVSVGRVLEKAREAPARVIALSAEDVRARPVVTPVDHLRDVPGIDVISQGLQSTNVVARGFNNIFSGALHALTDDRQAGVPSLRVNVLSFVPATNEDIERIEVVLGPGAALYGPNTANGVLHIITRSPLGEPGTSVSVMGGQRDVFAGSFRTSQLVSPSLGIKLSGQYLRGEEWEYIDPVEVGESAKFASDPEFWRQDLMRAVGIDASEAQTRIDRIAAREFQIERWSGEVRADWEPTPSSRLSLTSGLSNAGSQIELTGLGAAQIEDWRYSFYQARYSWESLFAQVYLNKSDAGTTFLLRNGAPIVDRSTLLVGQLQHQSRIGPRQRFIYGFDFQHTDPETEGTINGIYEDEDETTEFGAYAQSETELSPRLRLVAAGRVDEHSALPDAIFSPRVALVFSASDDHSFRATYNRAFSTPSSLNQFLDLGTAIPNEGAARLGYSVRVQGTGTDGFRFRQGDGSYLMRSPFTPAGMGGPAQLLPAGAAANFWAAAVQVVAQQAAAGGAPLDPAFVGYLASLQPTPGQISSNFFNSTTGTGGSLAGLDLPDVDPIRESTESMFEVGYRGLVLEQKLDFAVDVWFSERRNLVTPLTVQTPFVTLNPQETVAFLVPNLMALGMSQAEALATAIQLTEGLAQVPLGVISSADVNANGAQLLATYTNVGDNIDLWGADFSARFFLSERMAVSGSYSLVNRDTFTSVTSDREQLVTLNAPKHKGSLGLQLRDPVLGLDGELRTRFTASFPAVSGVYEGTACLDDAPASAEPCVDSYTLVDLNLSYRLPMPGTTLQLNVQNLLDEKYRSFPGVPEIGRMALLRLRYEF
jgi:outer membrane receptor for ferrienterochelin and colicins